MKEYFSKLSYSTKVQFEIIYIINSPRASRVIWEVCNVYCTSAQIIVCFFFKSNFSSIEMELKGGFDIACRL